VQQRFDAVKDVMLRVLLPSTTTEVTTPQGFVDVVSLRTASVIPLLMRFASSPASYRPQAED
jgi:hypothetical protein